MAGGWHLYPTGAKRRRKLKYTSFQPTAIYAGPLGWAILGTSNDHSTTVGWASPDGICWFPLPDEVVGAHAAVGTDALAVVDRSGAMWVGTPNAEPGC